MHHLHGPTRPWAPIVPESSQPGTRLFRMRRQLGKQFELGPKAVTRNASAITSFYLERQLWYITQLADLCDVCK